MTTLPSTNMVYIVEIEQTWRQPNYQFLCFVSGWFLFQRQMVLHVYHPYDLQRTNFVYPHLYQPEFCLNAILIQHGYQVFVAVIFMNFSFPTLQTDLSSCPSFFSPPKTPGKENPVRRQVSRTCELSWCRAPAQEANPGTQEFTPQILDTMKIKYI